MRFDFLMLAPAGSILALAFAAYLALKILRQDEGTKEMIEVANAVREGAAAYLKRQYLGVAIFFGIMFIILLALALKNYLPIFVPFAFLTGGFFSGMSGYIGMTIATRSSSRTTNAAKSRPHQARPLLRLLSQRSCLRSTKQETSAEKSSQNTLMSATHSLSSSQEQKEKS